MGAKSERFGVSMDGDLLPLVDKVARDEFAENRSAYLEDLARFDLQRRGLLTEGPAIRALARAQAIIDSVGPEQAEQLFALDAAEIAADRAAAKTGEDAA